MLAICVAAALDTRSTVHMGQSIGNLFRFLLGANCQTVSVVLFANLHTPFQLSVCLCRLCLSLCFLYFSAACVQLVFYSLSTLQRRDERFRYVHSLCLFVFGPNTSWQVLVKVSFCAIGSRLPHSASFLNLCLLSLSSFSSILVSTWVFASLFTPRTQGLFSFCVIISLIRTSRSSKKDQPVLVQHLES